MFKESCVYFKNSVVAKEHDSQLGVVLDPKEHNNVWRHFFSLSQLKGYYWYPAGRGQGHC